MILGFLVDRWIHWILEYLLLAVLIIVTGGMKKYIKKLSINLLAIMEHTHAMDIYQKSGGIC